MNFVVLILPLLWISSVHSSLYDGWPDHCCRLETKQIKFGEVLPEDYVLAGETNGEKWVYVIDKQYSNSILLKTERWNEYPVFSPSGCVAQTQTPFFEVLVNPNHCSLSWIPTRYYSQTFPGSTGFLFNGSENFAPAFGGYYFARNNDSAYKGSPAILRPDGYVDACYKDGANNTQNIFNNNAGHLILTVDCLKSLVTMSDGALVNVTYPDFSTPTEKSDVVYFHRTYKNDSPSPQKQKVGFSVERTNTVHVSLSQSYAKSRCDLSDNSFSSSFGTTLSTEASVGWGPFSAKVGASVSSAFESSTRTASNSCQGQSGNQTSDSTHKEVMKYTFSDEVTIPAHSLTTVKAYTTPFKGTFDYQMTYKLSPRFGDNSNATRDILMSGLKVFKMADKLEFNNTDVLVKFDGKLFVDSGYEVSVDVESVPLNGSQVKTLAEYKLIPGEQ